MSHAYDNRQLKRLATSRYISQRTLQASVSVANTASTGPALPNSASLVASHRVAASLRDPEKPHLPSYLFDQVKHLPDPTTDVALNRPDSAHWRASMADEDQSILANTVLLDTGSKPLEPDAVIVPSKYQHRLKTTPTGNFDKYKSRLVGCGNRQQYSGPSYAPVVVVSMVRIFLALFCTAGWHLDTFDVKNAFLQAPMPADQHIYIRLPKHSTLGPAGALRKLLKSLYGIIQAPHLWNALLKKILLLLGFIQGALDPCHFYRARGTVLELHILTHVDDILSACRTLAGLDLLEKELLAHFKVTRTRATAFIGFDIDYNRSKQVVHLRLPAHTEDLVVVAGVQAGNSLSTPMRTDCRLAPAASDADVLAPGELKHYQRIVGCAMFICTALRFDIAFTTSQLARFMARPTRQHLDAALHLARYLKGTTDFQLTYSVPSDPQHLNRLYGYGDCSLGAEHTQGRAVTGFVSVLNGAAVTWSSFLQQSSVALSTCEGELLSTGSIAQDIMFGRQVLEEFGVVSKGPTQLFTDNQPALDTLINCKSSTKTRHVSSKFFFVRHLIAWGLVAVTHLAGVLMPADLMTKPLPAPAFRLFVAALCGAILGASPITPPRL